MIDIKETFDKATGNGAVHFEHRILLEVSFELKPEGRKFTLTMAAENDTDEAIKRAAIKLGQLAATTREALAQSDGPGQVTHD